MIGPTALGFRHRDDIREITKVLNSMGIQVNICAPYGATPRDIEVISQAHFNVLMYPETGEMACRFLERTFSQPFTKTVPIGVGACFASKQPTIVFVGDSAAEEDYCLSAIGWASTKKLPILFIVEDNNLSILTEKKIRRNSHFLSE